MLRAVRKVPWAFFVDLFSNNRIETDENVTSMRERTNNMSDFETCGKIRERKSSEKHLGEILTLS